MEILRRRSNGYTLHAEIVIGLIHVRKRLLHVCRVHACETDHPIRMLRDVCRDIVIGDVGLEITALEANDDRAIGVFAGRQMLRGRSRQGVGIKLGLGADRCRRLAQSPRSGQEVLNHAAELLG